ncbi:MAG: flagellar hook-length control protein FliK [Rhodocyclaceae bacterium]
MPEVSVNPALAIAPVQASNAQNEAARDGVNQSEGAQSFSSVLREKQAAKGSDKSPQQAAQTTSKAAPDKAAAADKEVSAEAATAATTAPDLSQLLASVSLQSRMNDATAPQEPVVEETAPDAGLAGLMVMPQVARTDAPLTDKPAASAANLAASTAIPDATVADGRNAASQQPLSTLSDGKPDAKDEQLTQSELPKATVELAAKQETNKPSFAATLEQAGLSSTQQAELMRQNQSVQTTAPTHAGHGGTAVSEVRTPVGQAGWAEEVGHKLVWTAQQDSGKAELVLTPAHLGRVEISIDLKGDQASASFVAVNPVAREALQDAMPKLRDMLAQSGINLGQADVGAGQSGQGSDAAGRERRGGSGSGSGVQGNGGGLLNETSQIRQTRSGTGLVDTFA